MDKKTRPIFFTSDWHIGHSKSIEFDRRPFKDLDHMHESLITRFNSTVPENGITYFLGDMGLCRGEIVKSVIDKLNGTKILILGNHDKNMNAMSNMGFDAVMYSASIYIGDELITMTHCPLRGVFREDTSNMHGAKSGENWHGEHKHIKFSIENVGQFHLHGHIHSGPNNNKKRVLGKQMDVGVVANRYIPVSISEIESWIALSKKVDTNDF